MNELQVFNNQEFGTLRTILVNNIPWFVAKDITDKLGYSNGRDAVSKHVDEEDKNTVAFRDGEGRPHNVTIINESGVYSLVLSSKLPSAKKFKRWITSEVIPQIVKTGSYSIEESLPHNYIEALERLLISEKEKERIAIEKRQLEEEKKINEPKVLFADSVAASEDSILVRDLAKILKQNGLEIGEHRLYDRMRVDGYICKNSTEPTQRAMELKLFERVIRTVQVGDGSPREILTTKVTAKGQQYFLRKYLGH